MNKVEINVSIDVDDYAQVVALTTFLGALGSDRKAPIKKPTPATAEKEVKPEPSKESKPDAPKELKPEVPEEATPETSTDEAKESESEIKIEGIRILVAKHKDTHRDEIKAKLKGLGAKNVSSVPTDKYQEFYDYLNALK